MNPDERPSRIKSNLFALSTAAVLAVYVAGYVRTRAAAQLLAGEATARRPAVSTARAATRDLSTSHPAVETVARDSQPVLAGDANPRHVDPATSAPSSPARPVSKGGGLPATSPAASVPVQSIDSSNAPPAATTVVPAPVPATDTSSTGSAGQAADSTAHAADKQRAQFKDGLYSGWGTSRHGDIQASVEIKDGRIIAASITQCLTRYSCSWIAGLPPQVLARQNAEVDYVSGATQSSNAFYTAIVEALAKAK